MQTDKIRYSFTIDRSVVIVVYLIALLLGAWSLTWFEDPWWQIAVADGVATVVVFVASRAFRNSSLYDPYWSVIPPFILLFWLIQFEGVFHLRLMLTIAVVLYWAIRLTHNWLKTWPGLDHEDWRYGKLAEDTGMWYWPVSFLGIHLFPTILVFLGCMPFRPIAESDASLLWTDVLGGLVSLIGIEFERRADNQLRQFKSQGKGEVCQQGLWSYSRHPNYFGEICFWLGVFVLGLGTETGSSWIYGIGVISMLLLFTFVSIPMMEKRQLRKPDYSAYQKRVSRLIPWFPKR
ncbi:DUF1295 domain-containing protein [Reichenbachiella ulvae]|uniref:DUF1295 domain-containing protein n=1 Tax=Reichenbachiella ulvae TaxID=2980104 RepID=A0ABT3CSQ2_9BACT|nr:DUF1295 domain-containing protein [Reichenbachiella ulvae]MCV9386611.1 DUF1295 domain-containing protein [Reichenbachiella ulvae]